VLIEGELTKQHVIDATAAIINQGGTGIRGVQIGTAVTSIGNVNDTTSTAPFYSLTTLTSLEFKDPDNSQCQVIGQSALSKCTSLTGTLTFPKSLRTIGLVSFSLCNNITSIEFAAEGALTSIESLAFAGCTALTGKVIFPASLTSLGLTPFGNTNFTGIRFNTSIQNISLGSNIFDGTGSGLLPLTSAAITGVTTAGNLGTSTQAAVSVARTVANIDFGTL
jgi:hypothetical protein